MKIILILISALILSACSKGDDSSAAAQADPIYGDWYYVGPGSTSTQASGFIGQIREDGTIMTARLKVYTDGITTSYYYRKSVGTFVRNGGEFTITYSYETCNPIGKETVNITATSSGQLMIDDPKQGVQIVMSRSTSGDGDQSTAAYIEDRDCNKL